jgi:hypothetical protein
MNLTRRFVPLLAIALAFQSRAVIRAEEPKLAVETVLSGLTNPCGLAVQSSTAAVFVSDTGAGQIVKFTADAPNKSTPVVTGFPQAKDANNKEPAYSVGPLGLAFLNSNTLISGEGALKQGDEVIRVFDLPADGKVLDFNDVKQKFGPQSSEKSKVKGSGNFFGLLLIPSGLLVTAHGVDDQGWVLKADMKANYSAFDELKPFALTKAPTKVDALMGIAFSKRGFVVLGSHRENDKSSGEKHSRQSSLSFYNAKNGNLLMSMPTDLHDITGLAYSPKSGRLYAVDFAWDDPSQGGLYRLDAATVDGQSGVKAVKMTALDKPSTLAFAPDNTLYVTVFGSIPTEPKTDKPPKPGKLIKITGDL